MATLLFYITLTATTIVGGWIAHGAITAKPSEPLTPEQIQEIKDMARMEISRDLGR